MAEIKQKITLKLLAFLIGGTSFVLSFLIIPSRALAEEDKKANIGLNIGLSIANYTVSAMGLSLSPSSRTGLAVGVDFLYDVIEYISLGAGLMYIQKGGELTIEVPAMGQTVSASVKDTFNYLAIPIPVHFQANIKAGDSLIRPFALLSLEPSFLLSAKEKKEAKAGGASESEEEDITDNLESLDFGIGFGGGIKALFSSFFLSAQGKYILGLTNIAKGGEGELKNRAFTILLGAGLRF
jgi:hypothetical protein